MDMRKCWAAQPLSQLEVLHSALHTFCETTYSIQRHNCALPNIRVNIVDLFLFSRLYRAF